MIEEILNHRQILDFSIHENYCALSLSGGYNLSIECLVRFIGDGDLFVCANDHGEPFGLNTPFNAEDQIRQQIKNKEVTSVKFDKNTGDLNIICSSGVLQITCNSVGYENYQINCPNSLLFVVHGGKQK